MSDVKAIIVVNAEECEGVYVNGELVYEDPDDFYASKLGLLLTKDQPFVFEEVMADESWFVERGRRLPKKLEDVVLCEDDNDYFLSLCGTSY
jgi:hypothetical protein